MERERRSYPWNGGDAEVEEEGEEEEMKVWRIWGGEYKGGIEREGEEGRLGVGVGVDVGGGWGSTRIIPYYLVPWTARKMYQ